MASVLKKQTKLKYLKKTVICPVEVDLIYEILNPLDKALIEDAAECLAETFAGIDIEDINVSEPMSVACGLSKEDMFEFIVEYLTNVVDQELCLVAREKGNGRVVGVLACEDFNPDEANPAFEGNLTPMNDIVELLLDLDARFISTVEYKTGEKVSKKQYIHAFMGGARMKTLKIFVIIKLFELLIEIGKEKGYKGILGEATNPRSAKMCTKYCGFNLVYDCSIQPILAKYSEYEKFKTVPPAISEDCRIVYRPLGPDFYI